MNKVTLDRPKLDRWLIQLVVWVVYMGLLGLLVPNLRATFEEFLILTIPAVIFVAVCISGSFGLANLKMLLLIGSHKEPEPRSRPGRERAIADSSHRDGRSLQVWSGPE